MKNKKPTSNTAITLIALIITIIILLILAGITLSMVIGKNGIFNKANIAKEQTNESQAKEKVELRLLDITTQILEEEKRKIELNDMIKLENEEITVEKEGDTISIQEDEEEEKKYILAYCDGYTFKVYENGKVVKAKTEEKLSIEYKILEIAQNESTIKIEITFKSTTGIEEITTPTETINGNGKKEIIKEFTANNGENYTFKMKGVKGKELEKTINVVPIYDISSIEDLEEIPSKGLNKNYQLTKNLDFKDRKSYKTEERYNYYNTDANGDGNPDNSWIQLGTDSRAPFTGRLNGNEYEIKNLYSTNGGLFVFVGNNAVIENLKLSNIYVSGSSVGGLINNVTRSAKVEKVIIEGGTIQGSSYVGGLIGQSSSDDVLTINKVKVKANINKLYNSSTGYKVGGILGTGGANKNFEECCYIGNVNLNGASAFGGIVGAPNKYCSVLNSYSIIESISYERYAPDYLGGIIGNVPQMYRTNISNCFLAGHIEPTGRSIGAMAGLFPTEENSKIKNCYWDKQTSGLENIASNFGDIHIEESQGYTTQQMKDKTNYKNWDFTNIWKIDTQSGYPKLKWEK